MSSCARICRGHTHVDDVAANAEAFQHNEALLLIHFSMRCAPALLDSCAENP